ncbi:MAG: hypothetical protein ACM30H_09330 [Clostridia bacterium]
MARACPAPMELGREDLLVAQNHAKVVASETDLLVEESQRQREQMQALMRTLRELQRRQRELIGQARRQNELLRRRAK